MVKIEPAIKAGERVIAFTPNGELRIEAGVEDIYDALEARYGWKRFQREVKAQVLEEIARRLKVEVVQVETQQTSDEQQQEDDLREVLEDLFPDDFG